MIESASSTSVEIDTASVWETFGAIFFLDDVDAAKVEPDEIANGSFFVPCATSVWAYTAVAAAITNAADAILSNIYTPTAKTLPDNLSSWI
jgi:hypothetical protein